MEDTNVILLWGSNARETHPIFFHHVLRGVRNGAELYVVDPRRTSSARWAHLWLGCDVGSDISLANAMGREIFASGLANEKFIRHATSGFEAYKAHVEKYTLERAERETGVPAESIREWPMPTPARRVPSCAGHWVSPSITTRWTTWSPSSTWRCSPDTSAATAAGVNPLRGQNNVQGGGDMGAIPATCRASSILRTMNCAPSLRQAWGVTIPPKRGWHLSDMFEAMERGELTMLYVLGENPADSEADRHRALKRLGGLEFLVVQDLFTPILRNSPTSSCPPQPVR